MAFITLSGLSRLCVCNKNITSYQQILNFSVNAVLFKKKDVECPSIVGGKGGRFRRIVHYPDKYTVKPLDVTNLAGRDPATGRVVVQGLGGGIKRKYHWIQWKRDGPTTKGPPLVEKVFEIMVDWCRTSRIALVGGGNEMKYYLATENMKPGDLIRTSRYIPRIPVLPNEGDAYPLGALPIGTVVHNVERYPGLGGTYIHAAGTCGKISRRVGNRIIVQLPSKNEVSLSEECLATVGRLSNVEHANTPIGSAQRNRELGKRPRSGLWKRKDGRHGRKIRPLPPVKIIEPKFEAEYKEEMRLTLQQDTNYHHKLKNTHYSY